MTTTEKKRPKVGELIRFGDRDVEAEVVSIHHGWILARLIEDVPEIPFGFICVRE